MYIAKFNRKCNLNRNQAKIISTYINQDNPEQFEKFNKLMEVLENQFKQNVQDLKLTKNHILARPKYIKTKDRKSLNKSVKESKVPNSDIRNFFNEIQVNKSKISETIPENQTKGQNTSIISAKSENDCNHNLKLDLSDQILESQNNSLKLNLNIIDPNELPILEFHSLNRIRSYHCSSIKGSNPLEPNKVNQDDYLISKNAFGFNNFYIFGIFDGHGLNGHLASSFTKNHLLSLLTQLILKN